VTCGRKIGEFDCCSVVRGNCLELVKRIPDGAIDAVITDPPYGVYLGDADNGQAREKNQQPYTQFIDSPEYLRDVCVPAFSAALSKAKRAALFCGNRNLWLYPPADEVGCWFVPAATSRGKWGFNCSNVILYYGKSPRAGLGDTANSFSMQAVADRILHPCPKPLAVMEWLLLKASREGEIVLDPFCGEGATPAAAVKHGRHYLAFDIEPDYVAIARRRIAAVEAQPNLFTPRAEQLTIPDALRSQGESK
jgi:site-specific DNA-methyltransferase (adenine-specific)